MFICNKNGNRSFIDNNGLTGGSVRLKYLCYSSDTSFPALSPRVRKFQIPKKMNNSLHTL
jgi:hypothetical protein